MDPHIVASVYSNMFNILVIILIVSDPLTKITVEEPELTYGTHLLRLC